MNPSVEVNQIQPPKRKISISLDSRFIIFILLLIIGGMLFVWKPWQRPIPANSRTIEITGKATVKDTPDEFTFYPTYTFEDSDKSAALASLTQKSKEIIDKLKGLGVADEQIKTDSNGYANSYYYDESTKKSSYMLDLTITVPSKEVAQKVQDYLLTTAPDGDVSPEGNFSEAKSKALESKARDLATKDAQTKAAQTAKNLGIKVGKIKSVKDGDGFGDSGCGGDICAGSAVSLSQDSLSVQPGQDELSFSVLVVYYVR